MTDSPRFLRARQVSGIAVIVAAGTVMLVMLALGAFVRAVVDTILR